MEAKHKVLYVDYVVRTVEGEVVDESMPGEPVALHLGIGEMIEGFEKAVAGLEPGQGAPLFEKPVPLPDVAVLELRFTVFYQNDLGPIIGAVINRVIDLAVGKVPFAGDLLGPRLAERVKGRRAMVVTDENVGPLYGRRAMNSLRQAGFGADVLEGVALEKLPG